MKNVLNHVAFIMDGNGRWAKQKNQSRIFGHKEGIKVIEPIVKEAISLKIPYLSFFAFSLENWNRPESEVSYLIDLLTSNITKKRINYLVKNNVRVKWIGFEKNLPSNLIKKIRMVEKETEKLNGITVAIFFNYGGVQDVNHAFEKMKLAKKQENNLKSYLLTKDLPPVDLLIRTSGEKRISNFALYDLAYSEIIFEKTLWPDYSKEVFIKNLNEYNNRQRRFGKLNDK